MKTQRARALLSALKTPLALRIGPWIFVSFVTLQACAWWPWLHRRRAELYDTISSRVAAAFSAALSELDPALVPARLPRVCEQQQVLGASVWLGTVRVAHCGAGVAEDGALGVRVTPKGMSLAAVWAIAPYTVRAELDAAAVPVRMQGVVLDLFLVMLPAAGVGALVILLIFAPMVFLPLERLRAELASDAPSAAGSGDVIAQVRALAVELRQAKDAAESAERRATEAARAESSFFTLMTHELRTPLNAVLGHAELLLLELKDNAAGLSDVTRIQVEARRLLGLVNNLLDFSKSEARRFVAHIAPANVSELVADVGATMRLLVEANGNTLALVVAPDVGIVPVDSDKLRHCLVNLLANAAKFTRDGTVRLEVTREPGALVCRVRDSGAGISADELPTLFDTFVQGRAREHRFGGTGLGLVMVKRMAEVMGGAVAVESELGAGSTFELRLPLAPG